MVFITWKLKITVTAITSEIKGDIEKINRPQKVKKKRIQKPIHGKEY